ncbi:MAG: YdcF family protein [Micavibrio sp.]|nr:MAG: YdcF family protein [Micavibrio sp.]
MTNKKRNPSEYKEIADYMLVETELRSADLCFVFGGQNADHLADHAAKLYHKGLFPKILVSGGVATDDGRMECDRMRDRLVKKGVPEDAILVENKATNTGENVKYGMALIEKKIGLKNVKSLIGIGQIHASRRFVMTLERHWPDVVKMFSTPNYYPVPRREFHKDEKFREDVIREFNKVAPYKQKDFIREVDFDKMAKRIQKLPSLSEEARRRNTKIKKAVARLPDKTRKQRKSGYRRGNRRP